MFAAAVLLFFVTIPSAKDLKGCLTATMHEVSLCPGGPNYARLPQISKFLQNAVIVSEDAAFWDHDGIDWEELRRSFETNLEKGRWARGGSTLTQQLAKNVYLNGEKSLLRKFREFVIALRIEKRYSKQEILERYLNVVEFDRGVYGAKAAAKHYFGKTPDRLSVAESAWLAFLLPNPKNYSISFHKSRLTKFALRQMKEIIHRLLRFKRISQAEHDAAVREASAFFGGVSGESLELVEEFNNSDDSDYEPPEPLVEPPPAMERIPEEPEVTPVEPAPSEDSLDFEAEEKPE